MKELIGTSFMQYSLIVCGILSLMLLVGSVYATTPDQNSSETMNGLNNSQDEKTVNMYVIIPITLKMDMGNGFHPDHYMYPMEFDLNESGNMSHISPEHLKEMNRTNTTIIHHVIDRNSTGIVQNDSVMNVTITGNASTETPERLKDTNKSNVTVIHQTIDRNSTGIVKNDSVTNTTVPGNLTSTGLKNNTTNST